MSDTLHDPEVHDPLAPPPGPPVVVIGCGNLLRGDDAAGPILIRHLWDLGADAHARLVDGGTAGLDVAFAMRCAERVILIDACATGAEAGALFRVPAEEIEAIDVPTELHSHAFRWDHALAYGRWLLKDQYPERVDVWLIEAANVAHGAPLTEAVDRTVVELAELLAREVAELAEARDGEA